MEMWFDSDVKTQFSGSFRILVYLNCIVVEMGLEASKIGCFDLSVAENFLTSSNVQTFRLLLIALPILFV